MSVTGAGKAVGLPQIPAQKGATPIVCLTAYTTPVARLVDRHCDVVLVGDRLGIVLHGLESTLAVTLDMMILHGGFEGFQPKFVKRYAELGRDAEAAIAAFAEDVRARRFPGPEHVFWDL